MSIKNFQKTKFIIATMLKLLQDHTLRGDLFDLLPTHPLTSTSDESCTWRNYQSMGFCANVDDVSPITTSKCREIGQ